MKYDKIDYHLTLVNHFIRLDSKDFSSYNLDFDSFFLVKQVFVSTYSNNIFDLVVINSDCIEHMIFDVCLQDIIEII